MLFPILFTEENFRRNENRPRLCIISYSRFGFGFSFFLVFFEFFGGVVRMCFDYKIENGITKI